MEEPTHPFKGGQRKILPGDVFLVTDAASVQFAGDRGLRFRVTYASWAIHHGWVWLTGHVVDDLGQDGERRRLLVQAPGLILASVAGEA